ncbi:MAG: helix-turn-helix domain-containing protein [Clostridia bacterium]|nr:helix-turn-helix domain-containing protein [Clostridia bacterium]
MELSQSQLATMLGVSQNTVSNWECDIRKPDFDMLMKIAETLDVSTDYLLGLKDF